MEEVLNKVSDFIYKGHSAIPINAADSLQDLLSVSVSPRFKEVFKRRHGYYSGKRMSLQRIGNSQGRIITRERVRQIVDMVSERIVRVKPSTANSLAEAIDNLMTANGGSIDVAGVFSAPFFQGCKPHEVFFIFSFLSDVFPQRYYFENYKFCSKNDNKKESHES